MGFGFDEFICRNIGIDDNEGWFVGCDSENYEGI